jgi:hypothetical protein
MSQMNVGTPSGRPQPGGQPGQMTAVMRAMAQASGPKVLRIGLVQDGRVIEERIIKQRTSVTIGSSEKAIFVVPTATIPPQFKLFELIGNDYYLNFIDGMTGRVALQSGITDIASLRGQAKKVANAYQVRLTDEARGKVVVGGTTFLFQFVAPPPPQPRPQLPLAVKGGLASQIDWNLTIIAAFSFLLHFGVIGAMYSDWMDPVISDDATAGGIIDMMKNIPPAPVEVPPDPVTATPTATAAATAAPAQASAPKSNGAPQKMSSTQAAALSAQADQIQMQMLAAFGGGSAVQGALNRGDIPPVDLGSAAASGAGVSASTGNGLNLGSGGGTIRPGGGSGGLGSIGNTKGTGNGGAGKETAVAGPTGRADVGATTATVAVANAGAVVAGLRAGFRSCYNQGLNVDPTMSGRVTLSVKISPNGEVSSADPTGNTGLSDNVVQCLIRKVRNAQFDSPGPTGSTLQIPITFVQQAK